MPIEMMGWAEKVQGCTACPLSRNAQRKVIHRGNIPADVVFLAEAPGKVEDAVGVPFQGRAGVVFDAWVTGEEEVCFHFNRFVPEAHESHLGHRHGLLSRLKICLRT